MERARRTGPVRRRAWPSLLDAAVPHRAGRRDRPRWCAPSPRTAPNATSGSPATADPTRPPLARVVNDELQASLTGASVRTEAFVTVVVPESRLGRDAKEAGGGFDGRARVLHVADGRGARRTCAAALGMSAVHWLTSPAARGRLPHRVRPRRPGRDHRRPARGQPPTPA